MTGTSVLLFLLSFAFYLCGVCPTVYGGDSGEFIASAHLLGLPHAPGFPTYNLLAHAAQKLLAFGNPAYRSNVFSAVISALAVVLMARLLLKIFEDRWAAAAGAFLFALSPLALDQARVAEVFGLNLLFLFAILLALRSGEPGGPVLAAFLLGLGLGNHHTLVFAAPLFLPAFLRIEEKRRAQAFILSGLFFIVGLSVYATLPLRARVNPPVNFGDPETWSRFWAVITRKEFGSLSLHPAAVPFRDAKLVGQEILRFAERTLGQMGLAGLLLAWSGVLWGWKEKGTRFLTLAALYGWLVCGLGFELLSNLSPGSSIGQWRLERFFMIPLLSLALLAALGVARMRAGGRGLKTVAALLIVAALAERTPALNRPSYRNTRVFRDFGLSALRSAPRGSLIVIDRVLFDEPTSSLLVVTQVEGKRGDLRFLYRPGTLFGMAYGEDILGLSWPERYQREREVEARLLTTHSAPLRGLAFERSNLPFEDPRLEGLLYRPAVETAAREASPFLVNRGRHEESAADFPSRLMAVHFAYFAGKEAMEKGKVAGARKWFNSAFSMGRDMQWLAANIGGIFSHAGLIENARVYFERAVDLDPYFYEGHYGLGFTALKEGDWERAIRAYHEAIRVGPDRPEALYMLGVAYDQSGRPAEAREPWRRYLELVPTGRLADQVRKSLS